MFVSCGQLKYCCSRASQMLTKVRVLTYLINLSPVLMTCIIPWRECPITVIFSLFFLFLLYGYVLFSTKLLACFINEKKMPRGVCPLCPYQKWLLVLCRLRPRWAMVLWVCTRHCRRRTAGERWPGSGTTVGKKWMVGNNIYVKFWELSFTLITTGTYDYYIYLLLSIKVHDAILAADISSFILATFEWQRSTLVFGLCSMQLQKLEEGPACPVSFVSA